MMIRVLPLIAACALAFGLAGQARAQETLELTEAWIRLAPPSARMHAGYFKLANGGKDARHLVGAESPQYEKVELHASRITGGVATMEPVAQVEVLPGRSVSFAPGGLHLMLIGPKAPQKAGGSVPLTLSFSDGSKISVSAIVKRDGSGGGHHHHGH
jgi:hypothetical protein